MRKVGYTCSRFGNFPPIWSAWSENGIDEVHIHPTLFFANGMFGLHQMPGILVHEVSHIVLNTDDIPYTYPFCRLLARIDPDGASKNASNWEYYSVTVE